MLYVPKEQVELVLAEMLNAMSHIINDEGNPIPAPELKSDDGPGMTETNQVITHLIVGIISGIAKQHVVMINTNGEMV